MRFRSLGSGSAGNATLIESTNDHHTTRVLVDCGFGLREMEARLDRADIRATDIDLIFITHEHGDHIGSAVPFARRHGAALAMSEGTWRAVGEPDLPVHTVRDGEVFAFKGLSMKPFTVPHDAREPLQLTLTDGMRTLGILTDAGCETPHLVAALQGCDALLLECNHDEQMLATGPYPAMLKARVGGRLGHLSNQQAAGILAQCAGPALRHVVAAHLSEQNNTIDSALHTLTQVLGRSSNGIGTPIAATQADGTDWLIV